MDPNFAGRKIDVFEYRLLYYALIELVSKIYNKKISIFFPGVDLDHQKHHGIATQMMLR